MDNYKIGFFSLCETALPDSYVGATLVTDGQGIPLEFKCTHSLKPTAIQKSLYGDKLKPFVAINLCAVPLFGSLTNKPTIVFVNQPYTLSFRTEIELPVIYVNRQGETINLQNETSEKFKKKIENSNGLFIPIIIQPHPDFENDLKDNSNLIADLFNSFDLSEPFERIKKSVEILGNTDTKFK
jgi:hypothetical protein